MPNPNLTFGIELEFIAIHSHQHPFEIGSEIFEALKEAGIPVTGFEPLDLDINFDAHVPEFSRWMIQEEWLRLQAEEGKLMPEGCRTEDIEISSRKFHFHDPSWRDEIATVLRVLRRVEEEVDCRFVTNMSCGFHVHVGHDTTTIPLRAAKNIFQIVTAFERHIDGLHLPERFDEGSTVDLQFHRPVSWFHRRRKPNAIKERPALKLAQRLADIETVDSFEELGRMFECQYDAGRGETQETTGHNSSVNFDNLFSSFMDKREKATGTVEFREHAGTLDLLTIIAWVVVVVRIVEVAEEAVGRDAEFVSFLLQGAKEGFEVSDLLEGIGCPADVVQFYAAQSTAGVAMDETIGFLPIVEKMDEEETVSLQDPKFAPLIEQNDDDFEDRADVKRREDVIVKRAEDKEYGIHPRRHSTPSLDEVSELFERILEVSETSDGEFTEESMSECRSMVLLALGRDRPASTREVV